MSLLGDAVLVLSAVGGSSGLSVLVSAKVMRRKLSAEVDKTTADAEVASAHAADQIVRTALDLMAPLTAEVARAREEAASARQEAVTARAEAEETRRHLALATVELDTMSVALAELRAQCDEERRDLTLRISQLQAQLAGS